MDKNIVKLSEDKLRKIVSESVKRILKESSVAVRGTQTDTDVYPVPYSDAYVDRYGATKPTVTSKMENDSIEKYGEAIAQRIDYALQKKGLEGVHVQVNEDIDNYNEMYGSYEEKSYRTMKFDINIDAYGNGGYIKTLQGAVVVGKMFDTMSMVTGYRMNIETEKLGRSAYIGVEAYVKPDKNGMAQLQKEPLYQSDPVTKRRAFSTYRSEEDED